MIINMLNISGSAMCCRIEKILEHLQSSQKQESNDNAF
jgi:hypothetical protein